MKTMAWQFVKPILQVIGLLFGAYVAIDLWVVEKVQTKIEPIQSSLDSHIKSGDVIRGSIQSSLLRLENESLLMRQNQEKQYALLLEISRNRH